MRAGCMWKSDCRRVPDGWKTFSRNEEKVKVPTLFAKGARRVGHPQRVVEGWARLVKFH